MSEFLFLILVGVGAGLAGSVTGMASLVTYPALLAHGLSPIAANVTSAVATVATTAGAAAGSRRELAGQRRRAGVVSLAAAAGTAAGIALLLSTPQAMFARIVPFLIVGAAFVLVLRDRFRSTSAGRSWARHATGTPLGLLCWAAVVGAYAGYFAATAGVLMLALLSATADEPLAVSNAVKNVVMGAVNLTASAGFVFLAPVAWAAVAPMAVGCLLGSWFGPVVVRRVPDRPLRVAIAAVACLLALRLWVDAAQ